MKKACLIGIFIVATFGKNALAKNFPAPETRGVWISEEYLTGGPSAIESVIRNVSAANFNVIYVEAYAYGSTIYPSNVISNAGGVLQNQSFVGSDPMKTIIQVAHSYGIEVVAWFASPFLISQGGSPTQVPSILVKHPDWAAVQRDTTKHYFGPNGAYGYSFEIDPCVLAAANFMVNLFTECARDYPQLDGIESDIENDTTGWYGDSTRALFMRETGEADPLTLAPWDPSWLAWRRQEVTNLVARIYQGIKSVNSQCVVTAAVDPPYYGQQWKLESWDVWSKNNYVDMLEPMLYMSTSIYDSQLEWCIGNVPSGFRLSAGIGISYAGSVANAISEIRDTRAKGVTGIVIWHYGNLLSYPGALTQLKTQAFTQNTLPSYDDLLIDDVGQGQFHTTGTWNAESGGYGGTYRSASAVQGDTALFSERVLRSGNYALYGYWSGDSVSNCSRATVQTTTSTVSKTDTINQKLNLNSWQYVDTFYLNSGDTVDVKLSGVGGGNLIADAFQLRRSNPYIHFSLNDDAVPDSESILLKFSDPLLTPLASITSISTTPPESGVSAFVDAGDNTILHVVVPPMQQGVPLTLNVSNLLDASYDTLSFSQVVTYDPDSTTFIIDDATPNMFWKLSGVWNQDTSGSAVGGNYWMAKQGAQVDRVRWGPLTVEENGYYDAYVQIPESRLPLSIRCLYIVNDEFGTDSVYASQAAAAGTWMKLGNLPFSAGEQFAPSLTSVAGSDTGQYLVADAVMLTRSVEFATGVQGVAKESMKFQLSQNYPNPFNPTTAIEYTIPKSGQLTLKVYDILGRAVETLVDRNENAGGHIVQFDGSRFASGVYFYVLRTGNLVAIHKMLLLK